MGFANPIVCKHRSLFHQEAQFTARSPRHPEERPALWWDEGSHLKEILHPPLAGSE